MLDIATAFVARLIWPDLCASCGAPVDESPFCAACDVTVMTLPEACPGCASPQAGEGATSAISSQAGEGALCSGCRSHPFPFVRARAALVYGGALADAIIALKHGPRPSLARSLGGFLVPVLDEAAAQGIDAVLPVPLHPRRLRSRGFNQALELAREADAFRRRRRRGPRLSLWPDALFRHRDTAVMGHESPAVRRHRVAGAFAVRHAAAVRDRRLLVVDDVMTTGATLAECAQTLLGAGAKEVWVAALARAV